MILRLRNHRLSKDVKAKGIKTLQNDQYSNISDIWCLGLTMFSKNKRAIDSSPSTRFSSIAVLAVKSKQPDNYHKNHRANPYYPR